MPFNYRRSNLAHFIPPVALAVGVGILYVRTLAPGVLGGDAGELQFVPAILSLPHPTGTPLYVLLSKLWSLLPLGAGIAWRLNLLAALAATGAVVVAYEALRQVTGSWAAALGGALALALGQTFWEQAVIADKYAFNALLEVAVLGLALSWGRTRAPRALDALALVYGLSLAHHRTMLLLGPPLLGYVWWIEGRALWRHSRRLARLAALALTPLLLYLYLPWAEARDLPPGTWQPHTAYAWLDYVLDRGYTSQVQVHAFDLGRQMQLYVRTLQRDFGWIGLMLAALGLVRELRATPRQGALLLACFAMQALLAANYRVPRQWVFFLPSFVIVALWVGEGAGALWRKAERWHITLTRADAGDRQTDAGDRQTDASSPAWEAAPSSAYTEAHYTHSGRGGIWLYAPVSRWMRRSPWQERGGLDGFDRRHWPDLIRLVGLATLAVALVAWPCRPLMERYRPLRQAHLGAGALDPWRQTLKAGRMADRLGAAIADVAPDATIVADWEQATPLWYYQQTLGWRPDVRIVYPIERLAKEAARGRPLYLARTLSGLGARWHPSAAGPLVALALEPRTSLPAGALPSELAFAHPPDAQALIALAGYTLGPEPHVAGTVLPVTLHWRAIRQPDADYSVSLRLLGAEGAALRQVDGQHPVLGMAPTSRWQPGEVVSDYYELPLPIELEPGTYRVAVTLYRALPGGGWECLRAADGADLVNVATFTLVAR